MGEIKLPPLPAPAGDVRLWVGSGIIWNSVNTDIPAFTANQMTAYATEAERMGFLRGLEAAAKVVDAAQPFGRIAETAAAIRSLATTKESP